MKEEHRQMPPDFWAGQSLRNVLTGLHTELRQELIPIQGYAHLLSNSELKASERFHIGQSMFEHIEYIKSILGAVEQYLRSSSD